MKKPEKRTLYSTIGTTMALNDNDAGYNQAVEEYEEYLPDAKEILDILLWKGTEEKSAKAIAKRIGKEKK